MSDDSDVWSIAEHKRKKGQVVRKANRDSIRERNTKIAEINGKIRLLVEELWELHDDHGLPSSSVYFCNNDVEMHKQAVTEKYTKHSQMKSQIDQLKSERATLHKIK